MSLLYPTGFKKDRSVDLRPPPARLCPPAEQIHARLHWAGHDGQGTVQQVRKALFIHEEHDDAHSPPVISLILDPKQSEANI